MKVAGLLFVALIGCASAAVPVPIETRDAVLDSRQTRFVDGIIASVVESISQDIRDAGLDPFEVEKFEISYALPVPVLFSGAASVTNLRVSGASNIVINHINYAILTSRLTLDISLPQIVLNVDDAWFDLTVFGHNFSGHTVSRLIIEGPGVTGDIRLSIGIISGISVRDIAMNFKLHGIQYHGYATLMGYDITPIIQRLVYNEIPNTLNQYSNEINQLIEILVTQMINEL